MFIKRLLSTIILVSIIVVAVRIDWLCAFAVCGFIAVGLYEFFTMLEKKGINIYKYFGIGMGLIIPVSIAIHFELTKKWELLFIVLALLLLIVMQFRRRQNQGVIVGISTTIFGIIYVAWFFSFMIKIRYLDGGMGFLAALLLITKLGDIGAYLIGSRFGKTPLMPRVSPKKSVEGAVASLVFSIIGALVSRPFLGFDYIHLALLGASLSVLGQLGDLSESLMKRDCQVKDSGNIIPGMGGVLDEIDSLLFTAPVFYFYLSVTL
ncbi:MAG: phosphatidate cytidylyltransferase [Candidatus Omnitrophica bacterium]|jgi:phosphatidate cytidylyltransferase|nr:phosphatidate cytidylyltransferase [Candidatus Omnitrophota bacterium]